MQPFADAVRRHLDAPWIEAATTFLHDEMDFDGGHDAAHLLRVLHNARLIADEEEAVADWPVLVAAVLFHDLVNLPKDHPERGSASARSAERAVGWLRQNARAFFDEARLARIAEAIRCHSYSAGLSPQSLEAKILSDADKLEAVGAIGIARTFYVGGLMGTTIADPFDPWAAERPLDDLKHSVDHFFSKLLGLGERMQTCAGRRIADERVGYMRAFLAQLAAEMGVAPPQG